jgi:Cu/Ag efflux pump CusA
MKLVIPLTLLISMLLLALYFRRMTETLIVMLSLAFQKLRSNFATLFRPK